MAEIVNGFAEDVAAISFVRSNFRHGEVCLREFGPCGVHSYENLGDSFDVKVFGQFNQADMVVDDFDESLEYLAHLFAVGFGILSCVALCQFDQICLRCEDCRHIFDPRDIFTDRRVGDFELF